MGCGAIVHGVGTIRCCGITCGGGGGELLDAPHREPGGNPKAAHSWGVNAVPGGTGSNCGDIIMGCGANVVAGC